MTKLQHQRVLPLPYHGDCTLLGIDPTDGHLYAELFYDDTYLAQYRITPDGDYVENHDEAYGTQVFDPISLPDTLVRSDYLPEHPLNYTGMRRRGMRDADKVAEWIIPLAIPDKIPLLQALQLTISPMMIFGIAESRVLASTQVNDTTGFICREIRLLRALPDIQQDEHGLPYDYDTLNFSVLQIYHADEDHALPALHLSLTHLTMLHRPLDCIYHQGILTVADGGTQTHPCALHQFQTYENDPAP